MRYWCNFDRLSRLLRIATLLFAVAIVGYIGWQFYLALYGNEATTHRTKQLLQSTTFPRFEFRDANVQEATEAYSQALVQAGISRNKVRVRVVTSEEQKLESRNADEPAKESLTLRNIRANEAGMYLAGIFGLKLSVVGKEVRIHRREDTPLIRRTFKINTSFSPESRGILISPDGTYDFRPMFEMQGVTFPNGSWARYRPGSGKIEVLLPEEGIELMEIMTNVGCAEPLSWQDRVKSWFGF